MEIDEVPFDLLEILTAHCICKQIFQDDVVMISLPYSPMSASLYRTDVRWARLTSRSTLHMRMRPLPRNRPRLFQNWAVIDLDNGRRRFAKRVGGCDYRLATIRRAYSKG